VGDEMSFLSLDKIWSDDRFDPSETIEFSGDLGSYNAVNEGDIVVPKVSPTFAHGRTAIAKGLTGQRALATSEVFVLRAHDRASARFIKYRLLSPDFLATGQSAWTGVAGLKRVSAEFVRNTRIDAAAWRRRGDIADFLDRECSRIDLAAELAKRAIEQITHAHRPLRAHLLVEANEWTRVKAVAATVAGAGFPPEYQGLTDGDFPFVKASDLQTSQDGRVVERAANWVDDETRRLLGARVVPSRATVFPRIGAAMLKNTRRISGRPLLIDNNLCAVSPHNERDADYLFEALSWLDLGPLSAPGPVPSVSDAVIRSARIPWPASADLRAAAVASSESQRKILRRSVQFFSRQHNLLSEYRASLVHEAVSGRLDAFAVSEEQMNERLHAAAEGRLDEVTV